MMSPFGLFSMAPAAQATPLGPTPQRPKSHVRPPVLLSFTCSYMEWCECLARTVMWPRGEGLFLPFVCAVRACLPIESPNRGPAVSDLLFSPLQPLCLLQIRVPPG
jgi:hypothetical protein